MIKQHFISEETEQLALVKGLNLHVVHPNFWNPAQKNKPCWYQATVQKWLREKHGIHVQPQKQFHNKGYKIGKIHTSDISYNGPHNKQYDTYEEALETGLKIGLTLIP